MTYISKKKITRKFKKTKLNLYNLNGGNIKQIRSRFFQNFDTIKDFLKLEEKELGLDNVKAFNKNLNIINEIVMLKDGVKQMGPNTSHINTLFDKIVSILTKKTDDFLINETNKDVIWLYNNLIDKVKFQGKENIKIYISKYIDLSINLYISIDNELKKMKGHNMKKESNEQLDDTSQSSNKLLENYNKFLELCIKFLFLKTQVSKFTPNPNGNLFYASQLTQKDTIKKTKLDNFYTFLELNNFIDTNIDIIQKIKNTIENKKLKKEKGSNDEGSNNEIEIIVNTDNLYVYKVKSKAGAMKYGSGTDWCTASTNENMYEYYKDELYILQPKDEIKDNNIFRVQKTNNKYQLHLGKNQLYDKTQKKNFTRNEIIDEFKDDKKLSEFLKDICSKFIKETNYTKYDKDKNSLDINRITTLCNENNEEFSLDLNNSLNSVNLRDIQTLTFGNDFNQPLGTILDSLTNLQTLTFGNKFNNGKKYNDPLDMNKPLGTSLNKLTNLRTLTFGEQFNQMLGDSLNKLTDLRTLTFGEQFNQILGNSLDSLINLQTLTFGYNFRNNYNNLNTSLDKLTNLQTLTFGEHFNQRLNNSLKNLTKLQTLKFSREFNNPLDNSLDSLINLQTLTFVDKFGAGDFNQPLHNSLDSLRNLRILMFSNNFGQPLGTSLYKLTNLQTLTFGDNFNDLLGDSLGGLINLRTLTFGDSFNNLLGDSLGGLINLRTLTFGDSFNNLLGNSLDSLINLRTLTFGEKFNQQLDNSLDKLTNLQTLTFGYDFNQSLGNSLNGLTNLQTLIFSKNFIQPLGNSLNGLTNLQTLTFGEKFNQSLGNSLNGLTNLQTLTFGEKFNQQLDNSLNGLTNLQTLRFGEKFNQPLRTSLNELTNLISINLSFFHNESTNIDILIKKNIENIKKRENNWRKIYTQKRLTNRQTQKNQNKVNKIKEIIAPYVIINNDKLPNEWVKTESYNNLNNKNNNKLKKQSINNMLTFLSDKKNKEIKKMENNWKRYGNNIRTTYTQKS
jgi:hypothetical protein